MAGGISLPNLQIKVKKGYTLSSEEQLFLLRSADDKGRLSRRKLEGLEEYPKSVVDNME